MSLLAPLLTLILLGVAMLALGVTLSRRAHQRLHHQYEKLADRWKIDLEVPPARMMGLLQKNPLVSGHYRGREISVFCLGHGIEETRQTDTALRVEVRGPHGFQFLFHRRSALGKARREVKAPQVETGDEAFDKEFVLRSNNAGTVLAVLDANARQRLIGLWKGRAASIYLRDGVLTYVEFGLLMEDARRERIEALMEFACDLADQIDAYAAA